jgi:hypothetical protein
MWQKRRRKAMTASPLTFRISYGVEEYFSHKLRSFLLYLPLTVEMAKILNFFKDLYNPLIYLRSIYFTTLIY